MAITLPKLFGVALLVAGLMLIFLGGCANQAKAVYTSTITARSRPMLSAKAHAAKAFCQLCWPFKCNDSTASTRSSPHAIYEQP